MRKPRKGDGWQAEKSALTRGAILEAAAECLAERGYSQTTTSMIAEQAQVSRGAMMHHFPSRNLVIEALVAYLHVQRLAAHRELHEVLQARQDSPMQTRVEIWVESLWAGLLTPAQVAYLELLAAARTDAWLGDLLHKAEKEADALLVDLTRQVIPEWQQSGLVDLQVGCAQCTLRGLAQFPPPPARRRSQLLEFLVGQLAAANSKP
ncbi:TetR/AcrR family transcriptional regulator [Mangrovimicrobium sediminis]|uniref:TetR/AcrR family transcriptional regulator n=1 Tax=Mangrovimicrobium sediminis TaxID=2562682 RepID=UPI0014367F2E|nr:TetR/AcrR family transcriptional regulator [Haliea sp. SAOS-164]